MSDSRSPSPQHAFSYADKRIFRSFLRLFANHLSEKTDQSGEMQFNLNLEAFAPYETNNQVIRDLLNDVVKAFGCSIFTPHVRRGEPIEFSNEGVYLENTRIIPESIQDALDALDEHVKEANEYKYLLQYITQSGLEIGPDSEQSLKTFNSLLSIYHEALKVLTILVDLHNIKARWSKVFKAAVNLAKSNSQGEVVLSIRDLVDTYDQYQSRYVDFASSGIFARSCLYAIPLNIVSDLTDWHDMISGAGLTTGAGCEAILDPT